MSHDLYISSGDLRARTKWNSTHCSSACGEDVQGVHKMAVSTHMRIHAHTHTGYSETTVERSRKQCTSPS